ncbi:hypothetical protein B0A55_11590 [Friedmanniomyces simplex]|uniref:Uncharacterized protein n=2 Tax=Friedmanniomyces simplex TaxID=329884 RepID=A0A4U0WK63_9PEZI|nr:hypothetical protein B0A55_11590 [Friedmanniomyces simplex]
MESQGGPSQPDTTPAPPTSPPRREGPAEGILKTIMRLRGLSISEQSTFDFEPAQEWKRWPGARYGQDSPHLQYAKGTKSSRDKHASSPVKPTRPTKARKPKAPSPVKKKPAQPSTTHGVIPARDPPVHFLTLPPELRNRIYELIAVREGPHYPQVRPVWKPGKRRECSDRRFPLEPSLALANHQLREEMLSIFYGCNRFKFRASESEVLHAFRMTSPAMLKMWRAARPASHYLQQVELQVVVQRLPLDGKVTFELKKLVDGGVEITHDMAENVGYCCCLEDEAVAETLIEARGENDLMHVLHILSSKRVAKLARIGTWVDHGLYEMPAERCVHCRKPRVTNVGGG